MRNINITTFISLDGVMQAPGGPQEDPTNGFDYGGWTAPYWDNLMNETMGTSMDKDFDLLLGRRTYEIFAAHWPYMKDGIGNKFNAITKFVVATKPVDTSWENSVLINGDVVSKLTQLKKGNGPDLLVNGSSSLVQTLLRHKLVDSIYLWIFPVTIGKGKRIFEEGTLPAEWKLTGQQVSGTGVIMARYEPSGELKTGSFAMEEPTEREKARRKRLAEE